MFSGIKPPPRGRNYREHVGRCERIEEENLAVSAATATVATVRYTLATAVCMVAAAAAMFSSQGGHGRGNNGGRREGKEDGNFPNEIEGCTDKELARFERIVMKRKRRAAGRAPAPAIAAPIGTAFAQRCSGISFDVSVYMEESTEGKLDLG